MPPPFVPYNPLTQYPTGGLYPAVDVLAQFGEPAIPALRASLNNDDFGAIARSNAAEALFVIAADQAQVVSLTL
jgi:hypothetical protein